MAIGKLIAIDGIDGSGKSTLARKISENINVKYFSVFEERYMIKELLHVSELINKNYREVFSDRFINFSWMMDLFAVAHNKLRTLLETGENVILDRYILSAEVYSLATTLSDISSCFDIYSILPKPDICIYMSVEVEIAVKRIKDRKEERAFYEDANGLSKIIDQYRMMLAEEKPYPIAIIDGNDVFENVYNNCLSVLKKYDII